VSVCGQLRCLIVPFILADVEHNPERLRGNRLLRQTVAAAVNCRGSQLPRQFDNERGRAYNLPTLRPIRLVAQDIGLSSRKHGFDPRMGHLGETKSG
jgi:hypothetical protein